MLALVLAALPVPLLVGAYLWLDSYEPEPMRFLVGALVWGAVCRSLIAAFLECSRRPVRRLRDAPSAVVVAPVARSSPRVCSSC